MVWRGGLATPKIGQASFQDTHFLLLLSNISCELVGTVSAIPTVSFSYA
jgi:hypothetical protein